MNSIVEERELRNDIPVSRNILMVWTVESDLAVNCIKNIISNDNIEDESPFKRIWINMNGVYYLKGYAELLYFLREDVTVRKRTIFSGTSLVLSLMRVSSSPCYWKIDLGV